MPCSRAAEESCRFGTGDRGSPAACTFAGGPAEVAQEATRCRHPVRWMSQIGAAAAKKCEKKRNKASLARGQASRRLLGQMCPQRARRQTLSRADAPAAGGRGQTLTQANTPATGARGQTISRANAPAAGAQADCPKRAPAGRHFLGQMRQKRARGQTLSRADAPAAAQRAP